MSTKLSPLPQPPNEARKYPPHALYAVPTGLMLAVGKAITHPREDGIELVSHFARGGNNVYRCPEREGLLLDSPSLNRGRCFGCGKRIKVAR